VMSDLRTSSASERSAIKAALAAPSTGGAATRIYSIGLPSGPVKMPSSPEREARGVSRTARRMPVAVAVKVRVGLPFQDSYGFSLGQKIPGRERSPHLWMRTLKEQ
jgi:hypothetical protein